MATKKIGAGIIGVTPGRSWAAVAHVPALQALADRFAITAVSTTRQESADAAAREYGVASAYDNNQALVNDPAVDLVFVAVKVPQHFDLVKAAIDAGKDVYCEWMLGQKLDQSEELARMARERGVKGIIGLQGRASPGFTYVRDLIRDGYVGEVLSTTLIGSGMAWGDAIDPGNAYTLDKTNDVTLTTIPFGHTIDAVAWALGDEIVEVEALRALRRTSAQVIGTGETRPNSSEDQLVLGGVFAKGAVIGAHYRGGVSRGTNLLWEINGTKGDIQVTGPSGHGQMAPLSVAGSRGDEGPVKPLAIPESYLEGVPVINMRADNVARMLKRYADGAFSDLPDFEAAVRTHRLLDAIERSAATGQRLQVA